jgi:hypothetical protein
MRNFNPPFVGILAIFVILPVLALVGPQNPKHPTGQFQFPTQDGSKEGQEMKMQPPTSAPTSEMMERAQEETEKKMREEMKEEMKEETSSPATQTAPQAPKIDIIETMPQGSFLHPKEGMRLKGEVKIKFRVEKASSVEFYLRRPEALVEMYLGQGDLKGEKVWEYSWQTELTPNGDYFLFPKIVNEYGQYSGPKISITIENEVEKEKEKLQEIQDEIGREMGEIQTQEEEVQEKKEEMKKEMAQKMEELAKESEGMIKEEKKEETKSEIQEKVKEFSQEVKDKIERAVETKDQKEREKIKKEISRGLEEITKPIVKASKEEKKKEALELEREAKERVKLIMARLEEVAKKNREVEVKKEKVLSRDSDLDGLPDSEEIRLGTDPLNPDSDNDGFLDGSEFSLGFDPLKPSPADKIKYQNPQKAKPKISEVFKVEKVELTALKKEKKALKIQGKALPYSFVTIYIFSLPIVVVTKADENGNWQYVLDKPLSDGQHTVYATLTNNHGEIEESSEPFVFLKTGEKVLRLFQPTQAKVVSPAQVLQKSFAILIAAIIVFAFGVALIIMGILLREKKRPEPKTQ